jgi:CRISPR-associated endoribonuclease Cas6
MRVKLAFQASQPITLDMSHNQQVQGMIYHGINNDAMQSFLHEHGFTYEKRQFRLFVFSRLIGHSHFDAHKKMITFSPPISLYISSPWEAFLQNLISGLIREPDLNLGENRIRISEVAFEQTPAFDEPKIYRINTLSPVTTYSTLLTREGGKKTYYYSPQEKEFGELIRLNLIKKAQAFYGEDWSSLPFSLAPAGNIHSTQQKVIIYKGFVIKGWMGCFLLSGDPRMLRLAFDTGCGNKNSQGLGMFALENQT